MLSRDASVQAVRALFQKRPVTHLEVLFHALDTRSRMSVFRRLRDMGYFTSYTHNGRYYTLADIPEFDEYGLWRYQEVGFSQHGTLRATVAWRGLGLPSPLAPAMGETEPWSRPSKQKLASPWRFVHS